MLRRREIPRPRSKRLLQTFRQPRGNLPLNNLQRRDSPEQSASLQRRDNLEQ
jgi:hypothetical protein